MNESPIVPPVITPAITLKPVSLLRRVVEFLFVAQIVLLVIVVGGTFLLGVLQLGVTLFLFIVAALFNFGDPTPGSFFVNAITFLQPISGAILYLVVGSVGLWLGWYAFKAIKTRTYTWQWFFLLSIMVGIVSFTPNLVDKSQELAVVDFSKLEKLGIGDLLLLTCTMLILGIPQLWYLWSRRFGWKRASLCAIALFIGSVTVLMIFVPAPPA